MCYVAAMHPTQNGDVDFGTLLAGIQERTGLTHQAIADIAGVNRSQVWRWVNSGSAPGYEPVRRLAAWIVREFPALADDAIDLLTAAGYESPPPALLPAAEATARQAGIDPHDPDDPFLRPVREEIEAAEKIHGRGNATGSQIFYGTPSASYEAGIWDDQRLTRESKIIGIASLRAWRARDEAGRRNHGRSGRAGLALVTLALR